MSNDAALHGTLMYYACACYPKFEALGFAQAKEAADAASAASQEQPLLVADKKGKFPTLTLPHFGEVSGPKAVAVMSAFLVWVCKGENLPDSSMLRAAHDGYLMWKMETEQAGRANQAQEN